MTLLREFKQGCAALREQLLAVRSPLVANGEPVDAAYIARYWPGGALNDRRDLKGWARCYGVLTGLARLTDKSVSPHERAAKRAAVLEAIAETPETVELVQRDAAGNPRALTVYQKSDLACRLIHEANLLLGFLVSDYQQRTPETAEDLEILTRSLREQSYQQRLIVWIATTEGPGIPFGEHEVRPEIPDHLATLHSVDFYSLAQAFQRVNVVGFSALESSTTPNTRPGWEVFWSGVEQESGVPVPRLMRDRGLLSLVATYAVTAHAREEAEQRAKRERGRKSA